MKRGAYWVKCAQCQESTERATAVKAGDRFFCSNMCKDEFFAGPTPIIHEYKAAPIRASMRNDRKFAKSTGGRPVAGSGAPAGLGGDVRIGGLGDEIPGWLVERKETAAEQFRLKLSELHKIEIQAARHGRRPAFCVKFGDEEYVVMTKGAWDELRGEEGGR